MNERDFYYWLQGFFELSGETALSEKQVRIIKEHMALVAIKQTTTSMFDSETVVDGDRLIFKVPTITSC